MATQITVTGTFVDADNNPRAASVEVRPTDAFRCTLDGIHVNRVWRDLGDLSAAGAVTAQLWATTDATIQPQGVEYDFRLTYDDGTVEKFRCPIPHDADGGVYDLAERPEYTARTVQHPLATFADVERIVAERQRASSLRISKLTALGHSYGKLGVDDYVQLYHERLAGQLHADLEVLHVSGSKLIDSGTGYGGFVHMMRSTGWHEASYASEDFFTPRPGAWVLVDGINDLNSYLGTYPASAQLVKAFPSALRAVISWLSLGTFWPHYNYSTGQTFPAGSWSAEGVLNTSTGWLAAGRGPALTYKYSGSTGAQVQVVTPANAAGQVVALFYLCDFAAPTGGGASGTFAGGVQTFTVDGVATEPIGYEGVDFNTGEIWPGDSTGPGIAVARFQLPDDGASHTIVSTAAAGGCTYHGWGIEAPRPGLVANIARPLDSGGYTSPVDDDDVTTYNGYIADIVAEFDAPVGLFDMDAILGKTAVAFDDAIHPNPEYEARIANGMYDALVELVGANNEVYL